MTLGFFNDKPKVPDPTKVDALNTVRQWMNCRPFLPPDFRKAMYILLPALKPKNQDDFEHHPEHED